MSERLTLPKPNLVRLFGRFNSASFAIGEIATKPGLENFNTFDLAVTVANLVALGGNTFNSVYRIDDVRKEICIAEGIIGGMSLVDGIALVIHGTRTHDELMIFQGLNNVYLGIDLLLMSKSGFRVLNKNKN